MDQLTRIHIQGFRRLRDVDLPLKPLNVLIGANGCGKTSLLNAFSLLSASATGSLKSMLPEIGGVYSCISATGPLEITAATSVRFELEKSVTGLQPLKYEISLSPSGISYQIPNEKLTQHFDSSSPEPMTYIASVNGQVVYFDVVQNKYLYPTWDYQYLESALSQVPNMFREPESFRQGLTSSTHYHVLDVRSHSPVRLPQQLRGALLPGPNGEDLISCLYGMRESSPDRFEVIEDTLRVAFPGFERLNFPPVASGMLSMTWKDKEFSRPFYPHELSEGTLRFLWLVTLLYSPGLTEVTMIDEPEVSLHPELLSVLADCLREASKRTQLIVATHADRLVRFLHPDEVVAMDIEDGCTTATRADELDLDEWLKEYTLDQLWEHGRIGARP